MCQQTDERNLERTGQQSLQNTMLNNTTLENTRTGQFFYGDQANSHARFVDRRKNVGNVGMGLIDVDERFDRGRHCL